MKSLPSTLRGGGVMVASFLLAWASVGSAQTIRIRCGVAGSYTASDSTVWQGDQDSTGGVQLYTGYSVSSTPDPTLYRYARQGYYGDFSYNIPVTNGNYQLTLKFAEIEYSSPGQRVFNVTVNGTQVLTNFDIVAEAGYWTAIDKQFPVTVTGGSVQISVHGKVSVGLVNAIQIAPLATPALQLSGNSLNFAATVGGSSPPSQPVTIGNTGGGTLSWAASNTQPWLTLSAPSGTAPATLNVTAAVGSLTANTYTDTITVNGGAAGTQTVGVTFVVSAAPPPPVLSVGSSSLTFSANAGGSNPSSQSIGITNTGGGTLSWTASNTQSWLTLSAPSGTAPASLGISILTAGLTAGTYNDTVTIVGAGSTVKVGVTLSIAAATVTSSASFVKVDAATYGNWVGAYGADGYDMEAVPAALPKYVQLVVNGAAAWTWAGSTSDPRALQIPGGSGRIAATWYQSPSFNFDINVTDGNTHQFALYALDDDNEGRSQRIDILDAATGTVLDTRSMNGFSSGEYAVWNVSGHVTVKVTLLAGANAVVSGLFFGGGPQVIPPALNVSTNTVTLTGLTGSSPSQGVSIANGGGGTLAWTASGTQSWLTLSTPSGTAPSTLTIGATTTSLAAGTYKDTVTVASSGISGSPQLIAVTLTLTAPPPSPVLSVSGSSISFTGTAAGANPTPQSVNIANTGGGTLNWTASNTRSWLTLSAPSGTAPYSLGLNVSTSGLSVGTYTDAVTITAAGATGSPQTVGVTLTINPAASGPAASFIKLDTTTQGNWPNVYGANGYDLIESPPNIPSYALLNVNGAFIFTWGGSNSDARALDVPNSGNRLAATWYAGGAFTYDLNLTDGLAHQIALYAVDFDSAGRSERIDIIDPSSSAVLDTRTLTSFSGGQYLVWNIAGHVTIQVTQLSGPNAVVSAVFFDTAGAAPVGSTLFEKLDTITLGNWENAYGGDGYSFVGAPASLPAYATVTVSSGTQPFVWGGGSDARALEIPGGGRVAGAWYQSGSFSINVSMNDGNTHQLALYALDYDSEGRSERINLIDSDTGVTLDTRTIGPFASGQYLVWNVEGNIQLQVTRLSGSNAVVSGLFFGGSPLSTTPETLNLSTNVLTLAAVAGGSNPGAQGVTITNDGIGTLTWTATANQPWLTMSAASGTAPAVLSIGASVTGLAVGTYTGTVTVNAPGALSAPQTITVTLNVRAQPAILTLSQTGLTFSTATAGTNPPGQQVIISNAGTGALNWTAAATQAWVTLSATAGTAPSTLSIGVSTAGLANGVYTDTAVITAAGASGSPVGVSLTLVVGTTTSGQHYVSPQGTPTGDGSIGNPWDLQTALYQPASVLPGDTIWLRGGTYGNGSGIYYSRLVGTSALPIIVRRFPGERATIDGWLQVGCCDQNPQASKGAYVWFWGLEFASSVTDRTGTPSGGSAILDAVDTWAPGTKFINNIVHDSRVGISLWKEAVGSEAYGNVIYFNGFQASDRGHGHGFYVQNQSPTMNITNNIMFDQFDNGMQFYGTAAAYEMNLAVQGNISFNNGAISSGSAMADDVIFVNTNGISNVQLLNNYFYFTPSLGLGYNEMGWPATNQNIVVQGNYFMGGFQAVSFQDWASITFQNNTVYTNKYLMNFITASAPSGYVWDNNTYYGTGVFAYNGESTFLGGWRGWTGWDTHSTSTPNPPAGIWTFVEPNKYETGRANIAIYNWSLAPTVSVDVSSALAVGTRYQVLDAENYYGPPVASGTYTGTPITIPMTGLTIATPNGNVPTEPTHTVPQFGAFVLMALQ